MSITLQNYLNDVQRLLHDATNKFYSQPELIDYVNKARKLTGAETVCTRRLASVDIISCTTLAHATYNFASIVPGRQVIDVLDILVQRSSAQSYQLRFELFESVVRTSLWQNQTPGFVEFYTIHNRSAILLQWPSQAYPGSTFDVALEPVDLVNTTDVDNDIYFPYSECVGFYAAYLAKLKDQRRQDAEDFLRDYQRRKIQAVATSYIRRLVGQ